jgi:tRNA modification GTPase
VPVRVRTGRAPRTATGTDLIEILLPGAPDLVEVTLDALVRAGAVPALPGAFTRLALEHGRLDLDQALAVLALATAPTTQAAAVALERLRGGLSADLAPVRDRLLYLRAVVEAGLDFLDEADVKAYDPQELQAECAAVATRLGRWRVAAADLGTVPTVVLVGPANAGKSALFAALTGAPALVSPVAGTTRDQLEADWSLAGRTVRLIDTAGWMTGAEGLDAQAIARGQIAVDTATVILACSAPDAPLPHPHGLPTDRTVVLATKTDLGPPDPRAALGVRVDASLEPLVGLVAGRLAATPAAEPRQQRLLAEAQDVLSRLAGALPTDDLLSEDLRRAAEALGDLLGVTTTDDILAAIFGRFCIGK